MKGSYEEIYQMMGSMLKRDLVLKIIRDKNELLRADEKAKMDKVIDQMNRMNRNKRVRDKEIMLTSFRITDQINHERISTIKLYRMMFFNHYGLFNMR